MKFPPKGFNTYLILLALLVAGGCKSAEERKHDKTLATFRLHLEAPADSRLAPDEALQRVLGGNEVVEIAGAKIMVENTPFLDEAFVEKATVVETQDGGFALQVELVNHGKTVLETVTTSTPQRRIGILSRWGVDKEVNQRWLAAPLINAPISDGVLLFTPNTTRSEADAIALGLSNVVKKRKKQSALFDLGDRLQVMKPAVVLFAVLLVVSGMTAVNAQPFLLPTSNQALFDPGAEERFFVGTVGKPWQTGTFGCVRSEGWQMHEGVDIRCVRRDSRGEPADAVCATADGTVVYLNKKAGLSNYGNYLVLRHQIEGIEIYSLYAHLKSVRPDLRSGQAVKAGETIALMGRTTNTREGISKDRAHVHFELNLLVNDRFPAWYKKVFPDQRNDHGEWNGQNLLGIDPRLLLLEQRRAGTNFSLARFLGGQTALVRILVRETNFQWLKRYPSLVEPNSTAAKEGVAGYEIFLNSNGVAFRLIPRAASETKGQGRFQILDVNEAEYQKNPCRRLVVKRGTHWEPGRNGTHLLELMTY